MSKTNSLPCLFTFQEHDTSKSSISDLHAVLGCTGVVVRTNYMQNIGTHAYHGLYYDADHDYSGEQCTRDLPELQETSTTAVTAIFCR